MHKSEARSFHEDFTVGKAFDKGLMGRLLRYALPHRKLVVLALLLLIFVTLGSLVGPFIIQRAIDGPLNTSVLGDSSGTEAAFREVLVLVPFFSACQSSSCCCVSPRASSWPTSASGSYSTCASSSTTTSCTCPWVFTTGIPWGAW